MRILLLFAPKFLEWPVAIMRQMKKDNPNVEFVGIATGDKETFRRLKVRAGNLFSRLERFSDLEKGWLTASLEDKRLAVLEERLGSNAIRRILIGDRQLGVGFVSGGRVPKTDLTECVQDPELVRRYVCGLLKYVFGILESERPDLVFCYAVAGSVAIALAEVCPIIGVQFRRLFPTRIGGLYTICSDVGENLSHVQATFAFAQRDVDSVAPWLPAARQYIDDFRTTLSQPSYVSFNRSRKSRSFSTAHAVRMIAGGLVRSFWKTLDKGQAELRYPSEIRKATFQLAAVRRARRLMRGKTFTPLGEIPPREFAFFPLHVDPEASTMVLAPMHTDQLAVIESLAKSLPLRYNLVVKEHIPMLGLRPPGFYERIKRMPRVVLASPCEYGPSLVRRSALTCTITGTAAWEAIMLGRPAIVVGEPHFKAVGQGLVCCPSLEQMPEAVAQALYISPAETERLVLYVASVMRHSFDFPTEALWGKVTAQVVAQYPELLERLCRELLAAATGPLVSLERTRN